MNSQTERREVNNFLVNRVSERTKVSEMAGNNLIRIIFFIIVVIIHFIQKPERNKIMMESWSVK